MQQLSSTGTLAAGKAASQLGLCARQAASQQSGRAWRCVRPRVSAAACSVLVQDLQPAALVHGRLHRSGSRACLPPLQPLW